MLRPSVITPDLNAAYGEQLSDIADAMTSAMREAANDVKLAWREQIVAAGLGNRLANTIRANVYPKARDALNPAGFIYTRAPAIIDAFSSGPTIRPVNGARYLWIPTKNVPRRSGRGGKRRMDPEEVELHFNEELVVLPGKGGSMEAFLPAIAAKSTARPGFRPATTGRLKQGRQKQMVLMFVLRRTVKMPRKLNLDVIAEDGARAFERGATARIGR